MASDAAAESAKPSSSRSGSPLASAPWCSAFEPLGIVGPTVAQMGAENRLQVGKAGEAERLGEAHQGRSLHLRPLGDLRGGAERDFVGVVEHEGGGLAQALGQRRLDLDQPLLERFIVLRGVHGSRPFLASEWSTKLEQTFQFR